jgi:hypothetical protein
MKSKIIAAFVITSLFAVKSNAQSLAVNTDGSTANASALMDIKSTNKGMLIPRMSKAQKALIASPATGLLVFQNSPDSIGFHYYDGSSWVWLANSVVSQDWLLTANNNVTPSSYLGSINNADLQFMANGFIRTRLKANSGFWGFGGEANPQYDIDVSLGSSAVYPCTRNGIRLKPFSADNGCFTGFFMGLDNNNSLADVSIWNYGLAMTGAQTLKLGLNSSEIARFNSYGFEGLGEPNPQYSFDMRIGTAAVNPCNRNGIRINTTNNTNACGNGLFLGFDDFSTANLSSLWNFGSGGFGNNYPIRFGMGGDFNLGEKMRLSSEGLSIGFGTNTQLAKLNIIYNSGFSLPGVMTVNPATPNAAGFYVGLKNIGVATRGRVWNYMNDGIEFGTNDQERMIITNGGNVGIATSPGFVTPNSTLQVDGTVAVGVSMNVAGGFTSGTSVTLTSQKAYIGLNPTAAGPYYQLPDPTTCTGRIYYIRNNDNSNSAWIGTISGLLCPGNFTCLAPGTFYELKANISVKTVIAISDGFNWTIGRID